MVERRLRSIVTCILPMHYDKEYKINLEVNGDDDDNRNKDAGAKHFVAARQSLQLAGHKQYVGVALLQSISRDGV